MPPQVTESVVIGPTAEDSTTMGPVVSKVMGQDSGLIEGGIAEGARLVCGGPGLPEGIDRGYYVRPTVFSEVSNDMSIAEQEIFGPVLVMIPYDSEEEAIQIANDTPMVWRAMCRAGSRPCAAGGVAYPAGNVQSMALRPAWTCPSAVTSSRAMAANGVRTASPITSRSRRSPGLRPPDPSICNRG
ncbi:MAG: hypothetical protein CM15mP103_05020 [Gammaproteobacteria bacterium]|nr:MAG: hypothetical protein CM15mP103_05020 [Gammaproteobacteria bacterium]